MKLAIVYFSASGNTKHMAEEIKKGAESIENVVVKTMSIKEMDKDFIDESTCVIFGTPTYYASMAAEMKLWLDKESGKYNLAGKLGGAFATEVYVHGGADIAIQGILVHLLCLGMMTYSGGGAMGNPVIHMGPVAIAGKLESFEQVFQTYGQRMAQCMVNTLSQNT